MGSLLLALAGFGVFLAQPALPSTGTASAPAATSAVAPVIATEYVAENGSVVAIQGTTRTPLEIEGSITAVHLSGTELYVARGARGVAVYDVTNPVVPRLLREVSTGGAHATGFHVADGQLWVVVVSKSALPVETLESARSSPLATGEAARSSAVTRHRGASTRRAAPPLRILRVTPGSLELRGGSADGVRPGDRFAIFRSTEEAGESGSGFVGEELVAIATVVAVKEHSALADVGRGAGVRLSDQARPAKADQTASNLLPPHVDDIGEVSVVLRPLINAGKPLGAGVLGDVEATYWGHSYFASLRLQPVGLGGTDEGSIISTAALVEGGYEGQVFAVGLGLGMSWVNGDVDYMLESFGGLRAQADPGSGPPTRVETQETHSAFTLAQVARLGARDGLNLAIHNLLIYHEESEAGTTASNESNAGFIYGGTSARLAIPVGARSDLFLEGGGGVMGYWFAGAGVSTWIVGNGVPGSWRLSVSAGGAGIWGSREVTESWPDATGVLIPYTSTESININGPMVAAGLARRFSF